MTPRDLTIRPATRDDLPGLLALYRHLVPEDPPPAPQEAIAALEGIAAYPGSAVLIGLSGGRIVASCTLILVPNLTRQGRSYALIENVITDAGCRNRGFGKAMLGEAERIAWAAGCYKVMLLAGSSREGVLEFYRGAGYAQSKTGFEKRSIPARVEG